MRVPLYRLCARSFISVDSTTATQRERAPRTHARLQLMSSPPSQKLSSLWYPTLLDQRVAIASSEDSAGDALTRRTEPPPDTAEPPRVFRQMTLTYFTFTVLTSMFSSLDDTE
ncbi:hypothetical protein PAMP_012565 [Pampus punctatissimus]